MDRFDTQASGAEGGSEASGRGGGSGGHPVKSPTPSQIAPQIPVHQLFRREVIEAQRRRLQGEVLIGAEPKWLFLGYGIVAVLALTALFLCLGTYSRSETASGWLVPENGLVRLAAAQGGVVDKIHVAEGRRVTAGSAIALVRLSRQSGAGDPGKIIEGMSSAQLESARQEADVKRAQIAADRDALTQQESVLVRREADARALLRILHSKMDLAKAKLDRAQKLAERGFVTAQSTDDLKAASLDAALAISMQEREILAVRQAKEELSAKQRQIPLEMAAADAAAQSTSAALSQRFQEIKTGNSYTVNAPSQGEVMALPIVTGQNLEPGATVALFRDASSRLQAELFVPPSSAGLLEIGQEVSIQYRAFPYKQFGSAKARIVSISRAPLTPDEVATSGFTVTESVYRVRAELDKPYMFAYGKPVQLQVGAAFDAKIVLGKRTLLQWLFDPLFAVSRR